MFMGCKITSSVARGGGILPNPQARITESGRLGFGVVVSTAGSDVMWRVGTRPDEWSAHARVAWS